MAIFIIATYYENYKLTYVELKIAKVSVHTYDIKYSSFDPQEFLGKQTPKVDAFNGSRPIP